MFPKNVGCILAYWSHIIVIIVEIILVIDANDEFGVYLIWS